MNPRTSELFSRLWATSWFSEVGKPGMIGAKQVHSWSEAMTHCTGSSWEDVQLEAQNLLTEVLSTEHRSRDREWNQTVRSLKPVVESLVAAKTKEVIACNGLPEAFLESVNADILGFALESEFADVVAPGFFHEVANHYLAGHFPCGWEGEFPEGRLIVY